MITVKLRTKVIKMHSTYSNKIERSSLEKYFSSYKAQFRKMQRICSTVINNSEIDYITYVKDHGDHFYHFSTESAELTEFKFSHKHYVPLSIGAEQTSILSWEQHYNQPFLKDFLAESKMNNGIVLMFKHQDYCEYVSIGTRSAQYNLLLNHQIQPESIQKLAFYVKQACRKSMIKQPVEPITITEDLSDLSMEIPKISLPNLSSAKYAFVGLQGDVMLTKMEHECLKNILCLKTSRESATDLNLSAKTVEAHIAKLKKKLGVSSKSQMFELAKENGLVNA